MTKPDVVVRLEEENAELRRQLDLMRQANSSSSAGGEAVPTSTERPSDLPYDAARTPSAVPTSSISATALQVTEHGNCSGDCAKILRQYKALNENFKTARDHLRRRRDERDKWTKHAKYLKQKILAAEEQHGIQILDRPAHRVHALDDHTTDPDEEAFHPGMSFTSDVGANDEAQLPALPPAETASISAHANSQVRSETTETTQGVASDEITEQLPALPTAAADHTAIIKQEPSSDAPVVVSERELRKRKRADDAHETVSKPRIKAELADDSSPIMSIAAVKPHTQESLDLGDIGQRIQTPRKRPTVGHVHDQYDNNTPLQHVKRHAPQSTAAIRQLSALMPLSVNARMIRSGGDQPLSKTQKRRQLGSGISSLAEDGANYEMTPSAVRTKAPIQRQHQNQHQQHAKSRLDSLLDGSLDSAEADTMISRPAKRNQERDNSGDPALGIPGRRLLPFENAAQQSVAKPTPMRLALDRQPKGDTKVITPSKPPQQPSKQSASSLRRKPVSELRLEDFKVNAQANEGHDFAFSDVVRDKSDRACLPGCTDMHCCGKQFRALALSQRPDPPLTAQQRQEEQKLLEEYLGDYSYRLATMSKEERLELWVEAKTQELANKYGRHRHRFSRMQSPPGFWDADFPNTQDLEAEREEAAKRTKRIIADRRREALRPGGRWMFRDE